MTSVMKTTSRTILAALAGLALAAGTPPAHAVGLKQNSLVGGNMITLGDIFYDLPRDEDRILGPAPRPGQEMVLNARTLMRIAVALDLKWRPGSSADYIVLSRAATIIEPTEIENVLRTALVEQENINDDFKITFSEGTPEIVLPAELPPGIELSSLDYRADKGWFNATFVAPSKKNPVQRITASGRIEQLVKVPVLRESLRSGAIIGQHDIEYKSIPKRSLNGDIMINPENVIGMTPRRLLLSGEPIVSSEIEQPKAVTRGESITMVFNNGGLRLTAKGKALQDGARGDTIRVMNVASNRTIDATVSGDGEVLVETF